MTPTLQERKDAFAKLLRIEKIVKATGSFGACSIIHNAMREVTSNMVRYRRIATNTATNEPRRIVRRKRICRKRSVQQTSQVSIPVSRPTRTIESAPLPVNVRGNWSAAKQNLSPSQFRRTLRVVRQRDTVKIAKHAGRQMANHLRSVMIEKERPWLVSDLSRGQVEYWRRRHGVQKHRAVVMTAVAVSKANICSNQRESTRGTIGTESPRGAARKMIAHYGSLAGKVVRKMIAHNNDQATKNYWKKVYRAIGAERKDRVA